MARILKFYGASDDLFEIEGTRGLDEPDEIGCFGAGVSAVTVKTPDGAGLLIIAVYDPAKAPKSYPAVWSMGVGQLDEDVPLPDWPISFAVADSGYSTLLTLTAPDDAVVARLDGDE